MTQLDDMQRELRFQRQILEAIAQRMGIDPMDPHPGAITDEGRTFAPGSGAIAEYRPTDTGPAVDPRPFVAEAKQALAEAAVRAGTPDTPEPTGDTP